MVSDSEYDLTLKAQGGTHVYERASPELLAAFAAEADIECYDRREESALEDILGVVVEKAKEEQVWSRATTIVIPNPLTEPWEPDPTTESPPSYFASFERFKREFPDVPGVYAIYGQTRHEWICLYVGKSSGTGSRVVSHFKTGLIRPGLMNAMQRGWDMRIAVWVFDSIEGAENCESAFIERLAPILNRGTAPNPRHDMSKVRGRNVIPSSHGYTGC